MYSSFSIFFLVTPNIEVVEATLPELRQSSIAAAKAQRQLRCRDASPLPFAELP
jgi:hypothetical protein